MTTTTFQASKQSNPIAPDRWWKPNPVATTPPQRLI